MGTQHGWVGDTPFFLVMALDNPGPEGNLGVDLDTPWLSTYAEYLRRPGHWWLIHKVSGMPVLYIRVNPGDQPYFSKHHVGELTSNRETICFGIGKKAADGTMTRLWILPNGTVCGGEDVDEIALTMLP